MNLLSGLMEEPLVIEVSYFIDLFKQAVAIEPVIAKNIRGGNLDKLNHYI